MLPSLRSLTGISLLVLTACGDPEVIQRPGGGGSGPTSGGGEQGGAGNNFNFGGDSSSSGMTDPCDGVVCEAGLQCVADGKSSECIPITCAEANCGPTEECQILPNGGAICVDIGCDEDVDCLPEEYCNGTICVDDVCDEGATSCVGDDLYECAQNGSNEAQQYTCGSVAYFDSNCIDDGMGTAYCGCLDDWDCPNYTECDVDQCAGTGVAPTCQLPPLPFTDALPAPEIVWGGTSEQQKDALGRPFEKSSQVVMTPAVANLDDDNGDGLINERDFPEVLFLTFCNQEITNNGILRAIHGGGPNKGQDYFAVCGTTTWHEGDPMPTNCATGAVACANADINSTAAIAVGDIDYDGAPEIVAITEGRGIQVYRNDGTIAATSAAAIWPSANYTNPAPTIANLDNSGFAEVVVGRFVLTFANDVNGNLTVVDTFSGSLMNGTQSQGPAVCLANLIGDTRQEIVAGTTVYAFPNPPAGATNRAQCAMFPPSTPEETAYCNGQLLVAWDGQTVNGTTGAAGIPNNMRDGFCAVADLLGVDPLLAPSPTNPLDGAPEVVLINDGNLLVLDGETGVTLRKMALGLGADGGAPNIDDFDGDGFPEVGSAFGAAMTVIDLQDPTPSCPAWPT
ncbi:MAG: VCBS repeat-containing protein, partial [Myxococcales bacterium]|nr:VCBS repeat-containing protein [Myxococcales bacterium]